MDDVYFWVRVVGWWINFAAFMVLCYKFVYNNFTGKKHKVNWAGVGMIIGTLMYAYGVAEILYTKDHNGGPRVFLNFFGVCGWLWIAARKIPLAQELADNDYELEDD